MRHLWLVLLILAILPAALRAQGGYSQQGTVIRMRMADCLEPSHPLMTALSGAAQQTSDELCPEYTLVSDKVIYVIVGKLSGQLVPLAENLRFRLHKNQLLVRVDDEDREGRFLIRAMILRSEWNEMHADAAGESADRARHRLDDVIAGGGLQ